MTNIALRNTRPTATLLDDNSGAFEYATHFIFFNLLDIKLCGYNEPSGFVFEKKFKNLNIRLIIRPMAKPSVCHERGVCKNAVR
jgi:hypothetical protein